MEKLEKLVIASALTGLASLGIGLYKEIDDLIVLGFTSMATCIVSSMALAYTLSLPKKPYH